ncbi:hypothetical protein [Paenibacillus aceti]|uniref:Polysaccharide polymerase n=1 Tax=Paenibacillus aceti TaxID=1820010 RepID=A0ABQ1VT39_9BACL|nr:hypothetical protein [Paenibacillus aceti]GGF96567.1 hypothetical protein GCM10010913_17800 [Paenibacillus aceti]
MIDIQKETLKINNQLLFIILFLSIMPIISIRQFSMPVLYLFIPLGIMILLCIIFGWITVPKFQKTLILFSLLILIEIFLSTLYGTVTVFGEFIFPTDSLQYIAKFLTIILFTVIFYNGKVEADIFIKYFLIILNIGMLIGLFQWIPWPGREFLVRLYPFNDFSGQLEQLNRTMVGIRVHGLAQHATANGGLATFFFVYGFSVFSYYKKHQFLSTSLMLLSIINIFASQARAGILALVFSVFLFYVVSVYINRKSFKPTIYLILVSSVIYSIFLYLYNNGNPIVVKMVYRWGVLFETSGGGRVDQIAYFVSLLKNPFHYLFGLSKQVVNQSVLSYGVEVEPVNILVTYGALGFILQYALVLILLIYFLKNMRKSTKNRASLMLLTASFVGLASYQVFSVGYYFFREIRVGLFPWILMGVTIGVYERYKLKDGNL